MPRMSVLASKEAEICFDIRLHPSGALWPSVSQGDEIAGRIGVRFPQAQLTG